MARGRRGALLATLAERGGRGQRPRLRKGGRGQQARLQKADAVNDRVYRKAGRGQRPRLQKANAVRARIYRRTRSAAASARKSADPERGAVLRGWFPTGRDRGKPMSNERWRKKVLGNRELSPETLMIGYDPFLSERITEAAGLANLDLRLPHRTGRQGVLRAGLWPAPEAAERGAGPHLQPHQQSGPPDARDRWRSGTRPKPTSPSPRGWPPFRPAFGPMRGPARSSFIRGRSMAAPISC